MKKVQLLGWVCKNTLTQETLSMLFSTLPLTLPLVCLFPFTEDGQLLFPVVLHISQRLRLLNLC